MRRILWISTGFFATIAAIAVTIGLASKPAQAQTLSQCLVQERVCVASGGLITTAQQDQLEQQIGSDPIYLVVADAGNIGYNTAMNQIISTLRANNNQFVVGYLDEGLRHFGAYNDGVLPTGRAATLATQAVNQNQAGSNYYGALRDFVSSVQQQGSMAPGAAAGPGPATTAPAGRGNDGALVFLATLAGLALIGYLGLVRPQRRRRQKELVQQVKEAKLAAQDDLIALNESITDHSLDAAIARRPAAAAEQGKALDAYERGTQALDAASTPAEMGDVSRAIAEGRYRLACAEAAAKGRRKPGRRPMCFFDPRHGMSVADVSWAPPDGGPSREVAACVNCERIVDRGNQPRMRMVEDRFGHEVVYANAGFAPAYWGGFGIGGPMLSGFLLGQFLAAPPMFVNGYGFDPFLGGGGMDAIGGGDFGGGDFGGGFGGGDFGGGGFGGGGFGGGDFGGGSF